LSSIALNKKPTPRNRRSRRKRTWGSACNATPDAWKRADEKTKWKCAHGVKFLLRLFPFL